MNKLKKYVSPLLGKVLLISQLSAQVDSNIYKKFTSKIIQVDEYHINVEVLGQGDPVFFFPGGPGNSHDYMQGNFGHYYKSHKVVFIDFLGRGSSDNAKSIDEYSIDNDVRVTEEVRKALKLEKISLVGHSYGTVIAQAYAIKYKENVNKMVLINGFHSGEMWQANCDSYNHYSKTHFPEIWKKIDSLRTLGYVSSDTVFRNVYGKLPTKYIYYHNTQIKQHLPKTKHRSWNNDVYYGIIGRDADFFVGGNMIDTDFRRQLADLNIKTLIIGGGCAVVSTPEYAFQYKTFMPQAKFVMFENSGHNPYLEEPEKFYSLMDEFLGIKK